jgi:hypothetical protein
MLLNVRYILIFIIYIKRIKKFIIKYKFEKDKFATKLNFKIVGVTKKIYV